MLLKYIFIKILLFLYRFDTYYQIIILSKKKKRFEPATAASKAKT